MAAVSRLVRWLPKAVEATADDIARFGPQAGRVRSLLDFLPTMSDEAWSVIEGTWPKNWVNETTARDEAVAGALDLARSLRNPRYSQYSAAESSAEKILPVLRRSRESGLVPTVASVDAARAEALADVLDPKSYSTLTNPLNAGRAVDLLRVRPRYQGTPFLNVVQQLAERGAITGPRDVLRAGRIAQQDKDVMETALSLMLDPNNTIPLDRILNTARAL